MGFSQQEWSTAFSLIDNEGTRFGFPERRNRSVIVGSFNTLKLGNAADDKKRWDFLSLVCDRFDLLALQEVMDDLSGLNRLVDALDDDYQVLVSDATGAAPGDRGLRERLAFVYRDSRLSRDEVASDITYDRSRVVKSLYENRTQWIAWIEDFTQRVEKAKANNQRVPRLSKEALPEFLTFIRTPHCGAFTIRGRSGHAGVPFIAINAHTLYGNDKRERRAEFFALLEWLVSRAKRGDRLYHRNMLLMADLNMEFDAADTQRATIDDRIRSLNNGRLSAAAAARVNFPYLSAHPQKGLMTTNARKTQTYDHIAFFISPSEINLPRVPENQLAGNNVDGYDYGVVDFASLFAEVRFGDSNVGNLTSAQQTQLYKACKDDVSDHMPIWVRLSIPGA